MAEVSTQCPHCEKVMKLKSSAMLGKKVACPKCGESFTIKRYKEPEEVEEYDDAEEDYGEPAEDYEDYEEDAPRRRSASSSSRRSKGKTAKKSRGTPTWIAPLMIGIVVVLGLGGVIAGGVYIIPKLSFGSNIVNMAYLPAETEMVIHVRPQEIWNAALLAPIRDNPQLKQLVAQQAANGMQIEATDIQSLTMGFTGIAEKRRVNPFGGGLGPVVRPSNEKFVGVMRLSKDVTEDLLQKIPGSSKEAHNGQSVYTSAQRGRSVGMWLAAPRAMVFGDAAEVKKAIDRGATEPRLKRFDFANAKQHFFIALAPENPVSSGNVPAVGTPDQKLTASLDKNAKGFCFGMSVTSDIAMQVQVPCFDSAGAKALHTDIEAILTDAKSKMGSQPAPPIPLLQSLMDVGKETMNSMAATQSGSMVTVNGRVPAKLGDVIKEGMANPMFQGMMGAAAAANPAPTIPQTTPGLIPPQAGAPVRLQFNTAGVQGSNHQQIAMEVLNRVNPRPTDIKVYQVGGPNVLFVEVPAGSNVDAIKQEMQKSGFQPLP